MAEVLLPDGLAPAGALLLVAASLLTSALTAAFGLGGGVAMLAVLGLVLPVAALIPLHGAVQLGSNAGRAWHRRADIDRAMALPFVAASLLGAAAGVLLVLRLPDAPLKLLLGLFVLAMAWLPPPRPSAAARPGAAGLYAGSALIALVTMVVGATGPLLAALLGRRFADDRRRLVATHAAGMTVQHALKVVAFGLAGFAFAPWLPLLAAMIAAGYLGTLLGSRLLDRLPQRAFALVFRLLLSVLALDLVRRGLLGPG